MVAAGATGPVGPADSSAGRAPGSGADGVVAAFPATFSEFVVVSLAAELFDWQPVSPLVSKTDRQRAAVKVSVLRVNIS